MWFRWGSDSNKADDCIVNTRWNKDWFATETQYNLADMKWDYSWIVYDFDCHNYKNWKVFHVSTIMNVYT